MASVPHAFYCTTCATADALVNATCTQCGKTEMAASACMEKSAWRCGDCIQDEQYVEQQVVQDMTLAWTLRDLAQEH